MGSLSIWHWVILIVPAAVVLIPSARILKRLGLSPWLAVLAIVPIVSWVLLWVVAFIRWPIEDTRKAAEF